jgi:hypothetical protein
MELAQTEATISKATKLYKSHKNNIKTVRRGVVQDERYATIVQAIQLYQSVVNKASKDQR